MILVRFTGGLGNQMFQYALGMQLAIKNGTELKIDTTFLLDRTAPHEIVTHRELDIDIFQLNLQQASSTEIWNFNGRSYAHFPGKIYNRLTWLLYRKKKLIVEKQRRFQPEILRTPDNRCLVGAWQSEKYFKDISDRVKAQYTFKNVLSGKAFDLAQEISRGHSLCVNVRRGDYVTSPVYSKVLGAMPLGYFSDALTLMRTKQPIDHIFIFSDDIAWCQANLRFDEKTTIVQHDVAGPKFSTYLQLMSLCKHFIIPNSSFGWWAAWLGADPDKTVVAPLNWFKDPSYDSTDLVPDEWLRI